MCMPLPLPQTQTDRRTETDTCAGHAILCLGPLSDMISRRILSSECRIFISTRIMAAINDCKKKVPCLITGDTSLLIQIAVINLNGSLDNN